MSETPERSEIQKRADEIEAEEIRKRREMVEAILDQCYPGWRSAK
jgi:hypothetical protein